MKLLGSYQNKSSFIEHCIRPKMGDNILDIGCGPADILNYLPFDIQYTGIDFNEKYIQSAQQKFGEQGVFLLGDIADYDFKFNESFDIVIALGVIHHLPDKDAIKLLKDGYCCLKDGGRLITVDNINEDWIGIINKIALRLDRGKFIRNKTDYLALFSELSDVNCIVKRSKLRIPYYHIMCQVRKCSNNDDSLK